MEQKILDLYNDPAFGLQSREKFYRKVKKMFPEVSRKEIFRIVGDTEADQRTRQVKKPRHFNSIVSPMPRFSYQIDLMVYDRYEFHKYKYILMCIDVYSRYLMAVPLTTRKFDVIMSALKDIFEVMGKPKNINCDNEFNNQQFKDYCEKNDIRIWFSSPEESNKNAIVERVNRTIAGMLQKYRIAQRKYDWYNWLPKIVTNYNLTHHTGIDAIPALVWQGKENSKQVIETVGDTIKVGDFVLTQSVRGRLDKGDVPSYGKEIYKVVEKRGMKNVLERQDGSRVRNAFKSYELLKVNPRDIKHEENEEEKMHKETVLKKKVARALQKKPEEVARDTIASRTRGKTINVKDLLNPYK